MKPDLPTKFYRTILTVEILSREDPHIKEYNLQQIGYQIDEGEWSGYVHLEKSEELTIEEMAKALRDQGSIPEFLGIDDTQGVVKDMYADNEESQADE